jgi:hypothetical protein
MKIFRKEKSITTKYFNMENVSITGFFSFCKNNILLISSVSIMLFFTYGIKLFWYSIGIDIEYFIISKDSMLNWAIRTGRFGFTLLSKLWHINEFNPSITFLIAFCLIWFFTISWCYIIAIFNRNTGRNNKLIPFALVFMTIPIWAEQFYFLQQVVETTLMIGLCPFVIYLLYKGFLDDEKGKIVCGFILLVFMISVYQVILPIFCCGVFVCFVLLQEHSNYESFVYRNLCIKLFIALIGTLVFYSIIDKLIIPFVFHIKKTDYIDNMNMWGKWSIKDIIFYTLLFCYNVTIGHTPWLQKIVNPIIFHFVNEYRWTAIEAIAYTPRIWGNILLLPVIIIYFIRIFYVMRENIPVKRRLLYVIAVIGIPLSILFLTILGGGTTPPLRSLFALPLSFAFMFFYIINTNKKKVAVTLSIIAIFTAVYQAQTTAQLFYSDQMRYNEDVRLAFEFEKMINQIQPTEKRLPVVFIGRYQTATRIKNNFLQGEVIGHSFFEWGADHSEVTSRSLSFMNILGISYNYPNKNQMDNAYNEAMLMPSYPDPGCIRQKDNFIIVKLSEPYYPFKKYAAYRTFVELPILKDIEILRQSVYDINSVEILNDNVVLHCGTIDPQIYFPLPTALKKPSGETLIEITYTNSEAGYLMVHYDYGDGLIGKSNNTGLRPINVDLKEVTIRLPIVGWNDGEQLVVVRIDPPDGTVFVIKNVKLLSAEEL